MFSLIRVQGSGLGGNGGLESAVLASAAQLFRLQAMAEASTAGLVWEEMRWLEGTSSWVVAYPRKKDRVASRKEKSDAERLLVSRPEGFVSLGFRVEVFRCKV